MIIINITTHINQTLNQDKRAQERKNVYVEHRKNSKYGKESHKEGKGKYANQQKEKGWAPTGDCHSKSMDQGKIQVPAQVRNKIKYHSHPQKEKSQCTEQKHMSKKGRKSA